MSRPFIAGSLALLAACGSEPQTSELNAPQPLPRTAPSGLDIVRLTIATGTRSHAFMVEVARTEEQQARGLMGRRELGGEAGMLFPFDPPRGASFWMHDTLIPLDMLFIRPDGTIARIATGQPLSDEQIVVEEALTAVLELRGGRAAELGIRPGDRVSWTD